MRAAVLVAFGLAIGVPPAMGAPDGRVEMDVLELDEVPTQAVRRMEEAQQRAAARRRGPDEHPRPGAFLPEDSLGDRGLAAPAAELSAPAVAVDDDHGDRGRDKDKDNDKDRGRPGGG